MLKRAKLLAWITLVLFLLLNLNVGGFKPTVLADDSNNLAKNKSIAASSYTQVYVPQNANDGNIQTYWEAAPNSYPNTLTVDLGSQQTFNRIVIKLNPNPIWGARTQEIEVLGSNDNSNYTTIKSRTSYNFNPNTGNVVTITFNSVSYRYVRLKFYSNSGATGGQVAELEIYNDVASNTGKYEAENAALSGGAKVNFDHNGYSGTGFVDGYWNVGATTQFNVQVPTTKSYYLSIRYANATGSTKTVSLYINGTKIKQLSLPNLANWDTWADAVETVNLNSGNNTVTIKYESTDSGNINIDYITISDTPPSSGSGLPDVIITDIQWEPANPVAGDQVTFKAVVKNQGTGPTPAGTIVGVGFQVDGRSTIIWSDNYTQSIAPGESVVLTANGGVSGSKWTAVAGTHTISATVDDINRFPESNETNNSFSKQITVGSGSSGSGLPDVIITDIQWEPANPVAGDQVTFKAVVKNQGTGPTPAGTIVGVGFQVDGRSTIIWSDNYTQSIAPGESVVLTANGGVSGSKWTAVAGTHTISATVDDINRFPESNETNNSFSKQITVGQPTGCDLVVTNITISPSNPSAGQQVSFTVTIKNQGNVASPNNVAHTVGIKIDNSDVIYWNNTYTSSIPAGGSVNITINSGTNGSQWTATTGTHVVTAVVDYNNTIQELNETNNSYFTVVTIGSTTSTGRGADVPWIELEAENGSTNAQVVGPNRNVGDFAGEASGRKAVVLTQTGHYVEWTVPTKINAIVVRYCIPDAPNGGGINATLSLYVNGVHRQDLQLTSRYAWLYGPEDNPNNSPSSGPPRRIYDETRALIGDVPAGATLRLQKDSSDTAAYYAIDFVDIEFVGPPLQKPDNFLSITDFGATPNDTTDDSNAIDACIQAAKQQGKGVWIPEGVFYQSRKAIVDNITVRGAGMWYSVLYSPNDSFTDWGFVGFIINGSNCKFYDFSIFGNGTQRDTGGKAFCNSAFTGTEIGNVWIEHTNCGYWVGGTTPSSGLHMFNCRIRNTYADGINLCNSTKNALIENVHVRHTGDDGIAIWSATDLTSEPCSGNIIRKCTVQLPWRANAFAIYGGNNNTIEDCVAYDTLTYGGVNISSCFNPYPFSGTTTVQRVTLVRCGGAFWGGLQFGAFWINADDSNIVGLVVKDIDIIDSTFSGLHIQSETYGHPVPNVLDNARFENINIIGCGTDGIYIRSGSRGSATFKNVVVSGCNGLPLRNDAASTFTIIRESGNVGW